ncbi:hypothetical protein R1flu_002129 [Riccia fluitans]|uniref:Uncharacterized protein n=1 Tax=Riccia fluitans TaxID=41844 RepID=A0ABD1Y692_9MARC
MATPSTGGTPSVRDVRRARDVRFSFSPRPKFGSPSLSLDIEKFPPPPSFDDCHEEGLCKSDEKQNCKRIRLLNDEAVPSFYHSLKEVRVPLDFGDYKYQETPARDEGKQGQETKEGQQCEYPSSQIERLSPFKRKERAGADSSKDAEERGSSQGRAHKVFSGLSFSLGLEGNPPTEKSGAGFSKKDVSTLSPTFFEWRFKDGEFPDDARPRSPSFKQKTELRAHSVPSLESQRRLGGFPPSPKLSVRMKIEPTFSASQDDGNAGSVSSGKHYLESRAGRLAAKRVSSSEAEQVLDEVLQPTKEPGAVDSTRNPMVGMIGKKKEHQEYESSDGQNLASPLLNTSGATVIVLSQETDEKSFPRKLKLSSASSKISLGHKTPAHSKRDSQLRQREKVDVIDITTPPSSRKAAPKRPVQNSRQCSLSDFVPDSEEEGEFEIIPKRRKPSKPSPHVKVEPTSTDFLEDFPSSQILGKTAGDERSPGTPVFEQKKVFKRLRRGSTSGSKDSLIGQAPKVIIDLSAGLKKVKMERSDLSLDQNKPVRAAVEDLKELTTGCSQRNNQDEFDDIEDVSDCELTCAGSRPHRDRRSLQVRIHPKKLSLSTPSPASGRKPILYIPGLDSSTLAKKPAPVKTESVTCLETRFFSAATTRNYGNVKAEPITLSDDEEPALDRPRVFFPTEVNRSTGVFEKQTIFPETRRAGSRPDFPERLSSWKGKSPVVDGSDLRESFTESFSGDPTACPVDKFASENDNDRIAYLLRQRLPHFKAVDALLVDGGLDEEPVYIDYRNQFGRSQGMDSTAFADLDCTQPQSRRKQKRPSSKGTKGRKAKFSSTSSQRTTTTRSPAKGKRKAWTLFREPKRDPSASASTSAKGYWIVETGKRVYVKDGQSLSGRSAYMAYKRDSGKKSGTKTKRKPASKSKR